VEKKSPDLVLLNGKPILLETPYLNVMFSDYSDQRILNRSKIFLNRMDKNTLYKMKKIIQKIRDLSFKKIRESKGRYISSKILEYYMHEPVIINQESCHNLKKRYFSDGFMCKMDHNTVQIFDEKGNMMSKKDESNYSFIRNNIHNYSFVKCILEIYYCNMSGIMIIGFNIKQIQVNKRLSASIIEPGIDTTMHDTMIRFIHIMENYSEFKKFPWITHMRSALCRLLFECINKEEFEVMAELLYRNPKYVFDNTIFKIKGHYKESELYLTYLKFDVENQIYGPLPKITLCIFIIINKILWICEGKIELENVKENKKWGLIYLLMHYAECSKIKHEDVVQSYVSELLDENTLVENEYKEMITSYLLDNKKSIINELLNIKKYRGMPIYWKNKVMKSLINDIKLLPPIKEKNFPGGELYINAYAQFKQLMDN